MLLKKWLQEGGRRSLWSSPKHADKEWRSELEMMP